MRHLHTNLMMPACIQIDPDQVSFATILCIFLIFPGFQNFIRQDRLFCSGSSSLNHCRAVGPAILLQPVHQFCTLHFHCSFCNCKISLLYFSRCHLSAEICCCLRIQGKYKNPLHRLIQTMDNTQIRHLTRHLLSNIILQEALHIHIANPRILNCKPCRFVTDQNIFIFI